MKRKKIALFLLIATMFFPSSILAKENNLTFYTNMNGVELTKEQYSNLNKVFDEDTIATLTEQQINYYKNNSNLSKTENTKYIRTDNYYDNNGNLISSEDTIVNENDALSFIKSQNEGISILGSSHQTTMKKLTISLVTTHSVKTITITNTWLSIPSTKSYDVIGFRNGTGTSLSISSVSGYQNYDGNVISYKNGGDNYKEPKGGCGISMNIVDSVSSSLSNGMTVTIWNNATTYTAYGTYQHAQSNVTLAQSKNYTISSSGLGGVLDFENSVKGYYDGMQGVDITGSIY